jgi:CBS domain-containing protein
MLASQLIHTEYPSINLFDKASFALHLMEDYDIQHLAVKNQEKLAGIICKEDLLDADGAITIAELQETLLERFVRGQEHFFAAVKLASELNLSIIPVVNNELKLIGIITAKELLKAVSEFIGCEQPGGIIVLEIEKHNFSFGEIARLVETNDAYITQLNTKVETDTGLILVTIKINRVEVSDIVATFQRFDYPVRYYFGVEEYTNELKENYNHLIAYLNI